MGGRDLGAMDFCTPHKPRDSPRQKLQISRFAHERDQDGLLRVQPIFRLIKNH